MVPPNAAIAATPAESLGRGNVMKKVSRLFAICFLPVLA